MSEVYLKSLNIADFIELANLASTNYTSGGIVNINYLKWQYDQNPFGKPFMIVACESEKNELVGQYLVIPMEYLINSKIHYGTLSLNTLTRQDYRGKGLFTQMALKTYEKCADQNYNFTIGFPNQQSYHGLLRKLNFNHVGDVPLFVKPFKPLKILYNHLIKKGEKHGGDLPVDFESKLINTVQFDLLSIENDQKQYEHFWNSYLKNKKVIFNKTWEFIKWRYSDIPLRKYYLVKANKNDEIKALMIIRAEHTLGSKTGLIMDFMCLPDEINIGKLLIRYLNKTLRQKKIELAACFTNNNTLENNILKSNGFYTVPKRILPQPIPYMVRINKEFDGSEQLLKLENWQLALGDYDIF
ncbi:MAG: GNAT family N-acetyltransferase [Bacteroidota bacterium]